MAKPKVGDRIEIAEAEILELMGPDRRNVVEVLEVHESWDIAEEVWPLGEDAMAAAEADPGRKAEWYAIVEASEDGEQYLVCSFETE